MGEIGRQSRPFCITKDMLSESNPCLIACIIPMKWRKKENKDYYTVN